ncbi:MAG: phage tail tube protein [Moorellales bacterium]
MPVAQKLGYIGLAKQAAKGTPVAPSKFVKWTGETGMTPSQAYTQYWEGGMGLDPGVALKETQKYDGQFSLFARPDIAGFLFAMMLGVDTVSGTADPYTHTITPHASDIPWLTIERYVQGLGLVERIRDCRLQQIEISGEAGKPVQMAVTYRGIAGTIETTPGTPTYETSMPFVFFNGTYKVDSQTMALIRDFRITMANELGEDLFTVDVVRADLPLRARSVTGQFTLYLEDKMHYQNVFYGGGTSVAKTLREGSLEIDLLYQENTKDRELKIAIPEVYHVNAPVELNAEPGELAVQCSFEAKKGSADLVTVTVKNATSISYTA